MNKTKLFFKSIKYSINLVYKASGFMPLLYFVVSILAATFGLVNTYVLKHIIDSLIISTIQVQSVLYWIFIYIGVLVISQANTSVQNILYNNIVQKSEHLYDCMVLNKLSSLSLSVIDSSKGKDMVDEVRYIKNTAVYTSFRVLRVFSLIYTFIVAFITLVNFNIWFSFLFLCATIPGIILNERQIKKTEYFRREKAPDIRKYSYYRWMLTDAWPAKDVRMYDLTDPIKSRYDEEKKQYLYANKKLDKEKLLSMLCVEVFQRSGQIMFTAFVVYKAIYGHISIGDIALYIGFAHTISRSFQSMLHVLVLGYTRTTERMQRLFDFFSIKTENSEGGRKLDIFESLIFDNVYFKYPHTEKYVLSGASFVLERGDKLSIVGINGSGKSTIVKLMLGLYEIESGRILINGYPISDYNIQDVRKLFSVLFQNFVQYPLTLRENITLSDMDHFDDDEQIEAVLQKIGLYEDLKPKLVYGIDSHMTRNFDDNGTELSKGQWQKVALARTYFKDSPIIIFDEPSAALDAEAEDRIFKNFESISEDKTGIMISHRISSTRMSNKIIVLDGGRISEQGSHDELLSLGGLYAKLYNLQREKYTVKEAE